MGLATLPEGEFPGRQRTRGISARPAGFEPATYGSGGRRDAGEREPVRALAPWSWVERALQVPPCFAVSRREKAPAGVYSGGAIVYRGELVWS